ncbi:MAG: D-aminoacylase [Gemmatimonadetes bacterium]|nr:D-aminoacylase [Gemmatimonadota bacterium]
MKRALALGLSCVAALMSGCPRSLSEERARDESYDVVIEGGQLVDGTGNPWYYGDLAIGGDRIVRIAPPGVLAEARAQERIDARGLVVAPGFIDIQSQSGGRFLSGDGRSVSKITQGVTTEILGEGWTYAPTNEKTRRFLEGSRRGSRPEFAGRHGFDAWLRAMEERGISPNVGSFLGGRTIRVYAMGEAERPATAAELDSMKAITRWAMEDGAFGIAPALVYPPEGFFTIDELVEVAAAMAPLGGVYISHIRSEGDRVLEAVDEAIEIGRRANVPVEIFHLKAAGRRNWSKGPLIIEKIDSARAAGLDVQANMYPYVAGSTQFTAILPPWASADGKLLENLRSAEVRKRIHDEVLRPQSDWENFGQLATPEGVYIDAAQGPDAGRWIGKTLSKIAGELSVDWVDAAIEVVLSTETRVSMVLFLMSPENVRSNLQQPWIKFGTDAAGWDPDEATTLEHPRAYGTYPRILGRYVREEGVVPLEDAVRKMTSAVAARLSIQDRGILREGMFADVVVFNPRTIVDRATFEDPHQLSVGVEYVFVNGVKVVNAGRPTGVKPGRALRGPGFN